MDDFPSLEDTLSVLSSRSVDEAQQTLRKLMLKAGALERQRVANDLWAVHDHYKKKGIRGVKLGMWADAARHVTGDWKP